MNTATVKYQKKLIDAIDGAMKSNVNMSKPVLDQDIAAQLKRDRQTDTVLHIIKSMLAKSVEGVLRISPSLAKRIIEEANFPRNRVLRRTKVSKHHARVDCGAWRGWDFPITFAHIPATTKEPEKLWLINGQHRVTMISEREVPVMIKVHIADASDEEEAALLYTYFDSPEESRTDIEVLDARGITEDLDVPRQIVRAAYSAIAILRNGLEPAYYQSASGDIARDREARMADIKNWSAEIKKYWSDIHVADGYLKRKLIGTGVTAFALYVYRYKPAHASHFFGAIALNDGLRKTDPRHRLIADLNNRSLSGNQRQSIQVCAIAWNAFCENRDLSIIKIHPGNKIKVWGTPLHNGPEEEKA